MKRLDEEERGYGQSQRSLLGMYFILFFYYFSYGTNGGEIQYLFEILFNRNWARINTFS